MSFITRNVPEYLTNRLNVLRQIVFTAVFALVFLNIYSPFNASSWFEAGEVEFFIYSSLYILAGMLFILISRLGFTAVSERRKLNFFMYIAWIVVEILVLSLLYALMGNFVLKSQGTLIQQYYKAFIVTVFVLAIPYSISWLYYSWKDQQSQLQKLSEATSDEYITRRMINFYDETGKLRFTLNSIDVLYIESTDNYVTLLVRDNERIKKVMLRNTMKRLEKELEKTLIRRCHRSYMVNFENVKMVRLLGTSLFIYLENPDELRIPVSRTYAEKVHEFLNTMSV
jgi:DNA-binding LytR/AlgR family response regulator